MTREAGHLRGRVPTAIAAAVGLGLALGACAPHATAGRTAPGAGAVATARPAPATATATATPSAPGGSSAPMPAAIRQDDLNELTAALDGADSLTADVETDMTKDASE